MSLIRLPVETIVKILDFAGPSDIRRFQQLCRYSRDLVATNMYLQYILELDMCGYVVPLAPRTDLSYVEKIKILQEHRWSWQRTELDQPVFIELPSEAGFVRVRCFINGTFACGKLDSPPYQTHDSNYKIHFHQLPSFNKGTGYKSWHHVVSLQALRQFTIQPEHDLLVLLAQTSASISPNPDGGTSNHIRDEHYRLHFRTMTTNEPHPAVSLLARTGLDFNICYRASLWAPYSCFDLQVYGKLVAVLFRPLSGEANIIMIWDWLLGSQVAHIELPEDRKLLSLCFLSEDYLIIPRFPNTTLRVADVGERGSLGSLMLYYLPNDSHGSRALVCHPVAEFILPDHRLEDREGIDLLAYVDTACGPATATAALYQQTRFKPSPKIFDTPDSGHLIRVSISTYGVVRSSIEDDYSPYDDSGILLVPTQGLLDTLVKEGGTAWTPQNRTISIPWGVWGHRTYWVNTHNIVRGSQDSFLHEQRLAIIPDIDDQTVPSLAATNQVVRVWDFDQRRLQARQANDFKTAGEICSSYPAERGEWYWRKPLDQTFLEGVTSAAQKYTKIDIKLEGIKRLGRSSQVMISDEHVVVQVNNWQTSEFQAETKRGFLVYRRTPHDETLVPSAPCSETFGATRETGVHQSHESWLLAFSAYLILLWFAFS